MSEQKECHFNCLGLEIKCITLKKMKHIIEWAHAFTDEDSQAAWNMYQPEIWFSLRIMINAVDSTEQWRQNLIPQPPADTEKACSHGSHSQQHPRGRGGSKLCSRGTKFMQARQSCHCNTDCVCESPAASCLFSCQTLYVCAVTDVLGIFCLGNVKGFNCVCVSALVGLDCVLYTFSACMCSQDL